MRFILKNSERLFYWTGAALLLLVIALIVMQFTSFDEKFLKSSFGIAGSEKTISKDKLTLEEKFTVSGDILLEEEKGDKEIPLDKESEKALQKRVLEFLRVWEAFPRKDYEKRLKPYVTASGLKEITARADSRDSDLLRCKRGCSLKSSFPPQEIPLSTLELSEEYAFLRFTGFVRYQDIDGKSNEGSGLEARRYALLLVPENDTWLVARAIAR
jgi:hypothetical protein